MGSKKRICLLLLPVLWATRNLWDLGSLTYYAWDEEYVLAEFISGAVKRVDVTGIDDTEMILKIIDELVCK